jgi:hypothetical protein
VGGAGARATAPSAPRAPLRRAGRGADGAVGPAGQPEAPGARFDARIRYRHRGVASTLVHHQGGIVEVAFDEPVEAVSPGQAVVFYRGDEVVGGAWIRESIPVAAGATAPEEAAAAEAR